MVSRQERQRTTGSATTVFTPSRCTAWNQLRSWGCCRPFGHEGSHIHMVNDHACIAWPRSKAFE